MYTAPSVANGRCQSNRDQSTRISPSGPRFGYRQSKSMPNPCPHDQRTGRWSAAVEELDRSTRTGVRREPVYGASRSW
ncbi:MAG: hypothetical protein CMJ59_17840 [Planctomycetaceae bacterium]|nr:hypothetical protein [Planctomycetaceae bacterium]